VGDWDTGTQTISGSFTGVPYTYTFEQVATSYYLRFDGGPCVGIGVKLPAGVGLGLRAYWGLTKLVAEESSSVFGPTYPDFKHRQTLQAFLTYQFVSRQ
jgi:hypothetical protein